MSKPTYIILKSPQGKYKAVKCGDSYLACCFSSLWALYHGLFSIFFLNILYYVVLFVIAFILVRVLQSKVHELEPGDDWRINWIGGFCGSFLIKFQLFKELGNYWLIKKKIKEGYIITGVVETWNFFKVISLYKQNVNERRLAKRSLSKLKIGETLSETDKQYINTKLEDKDLETYRHALLKVKKWHDSELLELCERRFQMCYRNRETLLKVFLETQESF